MAVNTLGQCECCGGPRYRYLTTRGSLSPLKEHPLMPDGLGGYVAPPSYDAAKRYGRVSIAMTVGSTTGTRVWDWEWRNIADYCSYGFDGDCSMGEFVQSSYNDNGVSAAYTAAWIAAGGESPPPAVGVATVLDRFTLQTDWFCEGVNFASEICTISNPDTIEALAGRLNDDLENNISTIFEPDNSDLWRNGHMKWNGSAYVFEAITSLYAANLFNDEELSARRYFTVNECGAGCVTSRVGDVIWTTADPNHTGGGSLVKASHVVELMRCMIYGGSASYCALDVQWPAPSMEAWDTTCTTDLAANVSSWFTPLPPIDVDPYPVETAGGTYYGCSRLLHSDTLKEHWPDWYADGFFPVPWARWMGGTTYDYRDCLCGETPI